MNPGADYTALEAALRSCRLCLDAGHAIEPPAIFNYHSGAEVMLIGQAPGVTEVDARRPFNAGSGRRLFQWLEQAGWTEDVFRTQQVMTAVTKCYPGKGSNGKGDRVPSKAEQALCRPYLEREINLFRPRLIIPVGGLAIKLFYPAGQRLDQIIGTAAYFPAEVLENPLNFDLAQARQVTAFVDEWPKDGRWVVSLPHPSGASLWPNQARNKALIDRAIDLLSRIREAWNL
jgi:uracil-DNA glycosylase